MDLPRLVLHHNQVPADLNRSEIANPGRRHQQELDRDGRLHQLGFPRALARGAFYPHADRLRQVEQRLHRFGIVKAL